MKLRGYQEPDLQRLVELLNEAYQSRHEFIPYTTGKLQKDLQDVASILLAFTAQDALKGVVFLRRAWYGEAIEVCVRPGPQMDEVEAQLLSAIEPRVQSGHATVVVDAGDQERIARFVSRGYEVDGGLYQLLAGLRSTRPLPPVPKGYLLRTLRPDEEAALIELVNTAYGGHPRLKPGVIERWRAEDPNFHAAWIQVAEYEGRLVAAVVARPDWNFNWAYRAQRGYLGPAATLPAHTGRGLGKALTRQAMNFLKEQGMETVTLYTLEDNAPALSVVKSLGFGVHHHWKFLQKAMSR